MAVARRQTGPSLVPDGLGGAMRRQLRRLAGLGILAAVVVAAVAMLTWAAGDPSLSHATNAPVKNAFGYDDTLDVFGIHCVGGIIGAIATGILVHTAFGGAGIPDYEAKPGELAVGTYEFGTAVWAQVKAVLFTIAWSGIGSFILFKIVDVIVGLRVTADREREGLDLAEHGERAYNL